MAEILHGFEYGHAGKGFLRWTDPSVTKQWHAHKNQFQSMPETCPNAHDHSKCVTKMPVFAKGKDQDVVGSNLEIDGWGKDEVVETIKVC